MAEEKFPEDGQECEIKYKITSSSGEVVDSTENRPAFKFIVGDTSNVMPCISDTVKTMKRDEKKTFEINDPNISSLLGKGEDSNEKYTCEIELVRFGNIVRSIYELTDDEKFQHAQRLKFDFVEKYKAKDFAAGNDILTEAIRVMEKINQVNLTDEMKKFKISLMLNKCNCHNNLKEYEQTTKIGKEIVNLDKNAMKAYYHMGNAYAYLDEFKEASDCYKKLLELIPDKNDPGVKALYDLISKRKKVKDDIARRKMKAYFAQIEEEKKEEEKMKEINAKKKEEEEYKINDNEMKIYGDKKEEPKNEEPKNEEPKNEETKKEEEKKEEIKTEKEKIEEPKKENDKKEEEEKKDDIIHIYGDKKEE